MYAWAIGTEAFKLPDGVAMPVGGPSPAPAATLQIHYNNYLEDVGLEDPGSGIVLTTTNNKPVHESGTLSVGFSPLSSRIRIPPGLPEVTFTTECVPRLTKSVRAFAYFLHAHMIGKRLTAELVRDGEVIASLGQEPWYDFNLVSNACSHCLLRGVQGRKAHSTCRTATHAATCSGSRDRTWGRSAGVVHLRQHVPDRSY